MKTNKPGWKISWVNEALWVLPPSLTPSQQMLKCLAKPGKSPGLRAWGSPASTPGSLSWLIKRPSMKCLNTGPSASPYEYCTGSMESRFRLHLSLPLAVRDPPKLNVAISKTQFITDYHLLQVAAHSLCSSSPPSYRYHQTELTLWYSPDLLSSGAISGWLKVWFFLKVFYIRLMRKKKEI